MCFVQVKGSLREASFLSNSRCPARALCTKQDANPPPCSQALCPDIGEAKFYWLTDKTGTGPGFSENFLGFLATVGHLAMLAGVLAYQWCLKEQPFRRVFLWAQVKHMPVKDLPCALLDNCSVVASD